MEEKRNKKPVQPYQEYVNSLEEESRAEIRKARFRDTDGTKKHAHFSQPPPSRKNRSPTQEREESQPPQPQALPKLLAHESSNIDGRYFTAMSPLTDSMALLSGRTDQRSSRVD